jgi:hypothetical protein
MCVDGQLLGKFSYNYCMIGGGQGQFGRANDEIYAQGSHNPADDAGVSPSSFSNSIEGQSPYAAGGSRQYSQPQYG